jgi:pimeloyl-ACP methyl ester carboxylesterase
MASALALLISAGICNAQGTATTGRPILFVYGYCGTTGSWDEPTGSGLRSNLATSLNKNFPLLYPLSDPTHYYEVYYNATTGTVNFTQNGVAITETSIPSSARFFSMNFYDPNSGTWSPSYVQQISILNKAEELAHVLREINRVTQVSDVIVIAHSMGGLVSRAYLENMASILPCYNYNGGSGGSPNYSNGLCLAGGDPYTGEVAELITLDTPHGGADYAALSDGLFDDIFPNCEFNSSTTHTEQIPGSALLQNLNYLSSSIVSASRIPSNAQVQAIESYFSDQNPLWEQQLLPLFSYTYNDGLISLDNQSMESSLNSGFKDGGQFTDWSNPQPLESVITLPQCQSNFPGTMLHLLQCVGGQPLTQSLVYFLVAPDVTGTLDSITVQATYQNGLGPVTPWKGSVKYHLQPGNTIGGTNAPIYGTTVPTTFSPVPVGSYQVVYDGGGPVSANIVGVAPVLTVLDSQSWSPTFTISFQTGVSSSPTLSTGSTSNLQSDGATLNGTENPSGAPATIWFEWGTSNTLETSTTTPPTSGAMAASLSGISANTTYYFRIAGSSNGVALAPGSIQSFTTLSLLLPPTPLTPSNNSTEQSLTPQFDWTSVPNATDGYRLIVATNPGALPTDPNQDTCNVRCVLGSTGVIEETTTFTPSAGQLAPSTTYYWEVHGRSPSQAGSWSAISAFTTATATGSSDFSLQVSPSAQAVSTGNSASLTVLTATTAGTDQNVVLSVGNLPSGLTASFNPATVSSGSPSVLTFTVSSSAQVGTYSLIVTGTGASATHTYSVSLTVTPPSTATYLVTVQ